MSIFGLIMTADGNGTKNYELRMLMKIEFKTGLSDFLPTYPDEKYMKT